MSGMFTVGGDASSVPNVVPPQPLAYVSARHAKHAFTELNDLRAASLLCDVCLVVGNQRISAHRLVLSACSPYFRAMFTSTMAESRQEEILLGNISEQALKILIDFCYTGEITVTDGNVQCLLPAACLLQLCEAQSVCCEFLKKQLHSTNCLGIRAFADTHTCKDLFTHAEKYVLNHFKEVLRSEEFFLLSVDQLTDIIAKDELNALNEEQVYTAVVDWVNHDKVNRVQHFSKVLENVRLPLVSPEFLVKTVTIEPLIKSNFASRDLVDEAKNFHLLHHDHDGTQQLSTRTKPRRPTKHGQLLYAVGGWCNGDALASVERMDARTGDWRSVASMSKRRCGVGVAVLNDLLYAVGGHDGQKYLKCVERYDPRRNEWNSDVRPTATCRTSVGVAVYDSALYAVGGQDCVGCLNIVERYDPVRNEWNFVAPMNSRRLGVSVSVLDGQLYAVGGADGQIPLNTVERYDPRIDKWYNVQPMKTHRKHLGTAVYKNQLYAIGGRAETCELSSGERYDPVRNEWLSVAPMSSRRSGVALSVVDNQMYAVGGFDGSHYLNTVEVYEEEFGTVDATGLNFCAISCTSSGGTGSWRPSGAMTFRRLGGGVGVISLTNDLSFISPTVYDSEFLLGHTSSGGDGGGVPPCCLADFSYNLSSA